MNGTAAAVSRIVVITGFMGAGKTTVAAALSRRLGCRMIDLDEFVTMREGRTPQAIIEQDGEQHFRQLETRALKEALERAADETETLKHATTETGKWNPSAHELMPEHRFFIIALGGGAWTIERNRALVAEHGGLSVWLDAPFELCWRRIVDECDAHARPLARGHEQARLLYDKRRAFYELAALRVEAVEDKSAETLAAEIAEAASL
ncbi:MAG TPA: shikimate kinase [Pyrinomonadaceae bacterium]|jgi:shikimate kinase